MLLMPFVRADNTNGIPRLVKPHHFSQVSKMPTSCGSPERANRNGKIHEQTPFVFCTTNTSVVYLHNLYIYHPAILLPKVTFIV